MTRKDYKYAANGNYTECKFWLVTIQTINKYKNRGSKIYVTST